MGVKNVILNKTEINIDILVRADCINNYFYLSVCACVCVCVY